MRLLDGRSGDDVELTFDEHFHAGGSEVGDRPSHAWQHAAGFMDSVQVYLRHSFSLVCYLSLWTPRGVFFDCSRIKQHPTAKSAYNGAALAAAPHERAGFARADTLPRRVRVKSGHRMSFVSSPPGGAQVMAWFRVRLPPLIKSTLQEARSHVTAPLSHVTREDVPCANLIPVLECA